MTHIFLTEQNIQDILDKFPHQASYVYNEKILIEKSQEFLKFPSAFGHTVRYAIKANSHKKILQLFYKQGFYFDASSEFEYQRLLMNGIPPQYIQVSSQQIPHTYRKDIFLNKIFTACSLYQLEEYGKQCPQSQISIRVNPGIGSSSHQKTNVGGNNSSFGIWFEYIDEIKEILNKYQLKLTKIHIHIGSGANPEISYQVAKKVLNYICQHFPSIEIVNLGGGFKVNRMNEEKDVSLKKIGEKLIPLFKEASKKLGKNIHLEIEPGTALTALAGNLVCRVDDIVHTGKNKELSFIKINTGMDTITRPMLYNATHPIKTINNNRKTKKYIIVGHCCESGDSFSTLNANNQFMEYTLPELHIGDPLIIGGVGSYCQSMSLKAYNSFPTSPEFWIDKDTQLTQITQSLNIKNFTSWENV